MIESISIRGKGIVSKAENERKCAIQGSNTLILLCS